MRIKAATPIIIIGFIATIFFRFIAIAAIDAPHNASNNISCGSCHGAALLNSPFWGGTMSYDQLCINCHRASSGPYTDTNAPLVRTHSSLTTDNGYGDWTKECRTCHDPHYQKQKNYKNTDAGNLYLATGTITACVYNGDGTSTLTYSIITYKSGWEWNPPVNTKLVAKTGDYRRTILFPNVGKLGYSYPVTGVDSIAKKITVTGNATAYLYPPTTFAVMYGQYIKDSIDLSGTGKAVKFFDQAGTKSFADGDTTYNGVCEVCHTKTTHFRNNGGAPDQRHTNICDEVPMSDCKGCHTHSGGFKESDRCIDCHSASFCGRAAVTKQFNYNSHHIQDITLMDEQCYQCHWEANSDGSINNTYHEGYNTVTKAGVSGSKADLVIYGVGSRPVTYTPDITAIQYIANGGRLEIEKLNAHCLSCHSDQNNTTEPFGDGKTPNAYAWDNESIKIKYSNTGTTTWGKYTGTKRAAKQITKAYSAHGKAVLNSGGWDSTSGVDGTIPNTRAGFANVVCFDCHNSHGSSVEGITTSYTSSTTNGGILKDSEAGKGGYSMTYMPKAGGSEVNKTPYNAGAGLCFDCHMNANEGITPWGYDSTFGATEPIKGYYDRSYFDFSSSAPGAKQRFSYRMGVSGTGGGHFEVSSALSSTPTSPISGLCTPCHDPHGVSTTLNQEYAVPLLKGTWLTSPYKEDKPPSVKRAGTERTDMGREGVKYNIDQNIFGSGITDNTLPGIQETDSKFAGLCLRCHPKESLTNGTNGGTWKSVDRIHESVKGWGANVKHNYPCSKCHTPHSSGLPRLMITNCLDYTHKGRLGYNESPVISGSGSGGKVWPCVDMCGEFEVRRGNPPRGSGGGRIPGSFYSDYLYRQYGELHDVTCHENKTGSNTNHSWNVKTMWFEELPFITSGPEAGSFKAVGNDIQATITWTTKDDSTSHVEYGFTSGYGSIKVESTLVKTHSITLTGLENHRTYHYKVKSSSDGGVTWSESDDHTFYISVPPTVPVYIPEPDTECLSSCSFILEWNASSDPDGGPIEYYVEVDDISTFSSSAFNSGWLSENIYCSGNICRWPTPELPSPNTWYWRVKARDGNHTEAVSGWSYIDSLLAYTVPPVTPVIEESFEESKSVGDGYDIAPWTPIVGTNCTLNPDSALPGTPQFDAGYQCLQSISNWSGYQAYATLDYGSELPKTFTRVYLYLQNEYFAFGDKEDIGALLDTSDSDVFQLRLRRQASGGQLQFGLRYFYNNGGSYQDYWMDISINRWYKVEIIFDRTVNHWEWRVDGVLQDQGFTGSNPATGIQKWALGFLGSHSESGTVYFDMLRVYDVMPPDPPPPPELDDEPNVTSIDPVSVELNWHSAACPDSDPTQYYVQIDDASNFSSPDYISGWISDIYWTTPDLPAGKTWYWRVLARDSVHTDAISEWSAFDSFTIYPPAPPAPTLIDELDFTSTMDIVPVKLEWHPVACPDGDEVQYRVQVVDVNDQTHWDNPNYSTGWLSGVTSTIISLSAGKTWYWRVQARDEVHINAESPWSNIDSFAISLPPPPAPVLIPEPDIMSPTPSVPVSVTLNWNSVTCPDGDPADYRVQVDNNNDFSSPIETSDWILSTNYTTVPLTSGKTWYWRAQARDKIHQYSESVWSSPDSFKVTPNLPPPAPTLTDEPDFDGSITGYDTKLEWAPAVDPDDHPVQYYVVVYDNPNYSGTPVHLTTDWISGTSFNITVAPCTELWWRVKARDAVDTSQESGWSSGDIFADILGEDCLAFFTPTAPILADEPDNECTGWCYVTVNWSYSTSGGYGPIEYKVQVKKEGTSWTNSEYASDWFTARNWWTTTDSIGANASQTWWWRVQARDQNHPDIVSYALQDSFRVVPTGNTTRSPSIPYPKVEPDQECTAPCPVTLEWYASTNPSGGVQYQVYVDDDSNFSSLEFNSGWISDTSYEIIVRPYNDVTLYWKVRARDAGDINDETLFSGVDSFKVKQPPDSPPLAPVLTAEPNFNSDSSTNITLQWNPEPDPDGHGVQYQVWVDDDPDFTDPIAYNSGWTSNLSFDITVNSCTEWFWKVKAKDVSDGAESPWSDVDFFVDISASCTGYYTPSVPVIINEPNNNSTSVTLEWYPSTGNGNGPYDYQVYVDDDPGFTLPIAHDSLWISGSYYCDETKCSWSFTSSNNHKWYWKVRARDPNHSGTTTSWSGTDFFWVLPPNSAPPAPTLIDEPDYNGGGTDTNIRLEWIPETDPDGHSVQYYVEVDNNEDFGSREFIANWISDAWFDITVAPCTKWWWRVRARDAVDTGQVSAWSSTDNFKDSTVTCSYTIINESFENPGYPGYDEAGLWTETVGTNCSLDENSTIPGTAPPGSGSQCLKSISGSSPSEYKAFATLDYGSVQPNTSTSFYLYVGAEGLSDGEVKTIGALRDDVDNNIFIFRLNQNSGQLRFNLRVYNGVTWIDDYYDISLSTWYKIKVKYDNLGDTWEWWVADISQGNGSLTGTHYAGIQRWNFGFMVTTQTETGTIYYDLIEVKTNE